uniref:Uncharacterized protein n=1 Tax=Trichogramma kaykai TaxID=54128 RepID=A0ABD2WG81_9HYME
MLFETNDHIQQRLVQIDARDILGRTPLQCAVANLLPSVVDILLEQGADLSSFVFPTESHFVERFKERHGQPNFHLRLASGLMSILESLQKKGYELKRSDALMIMKFFANYGLFEKDASLVQRLRDDENFSIEAKNIKIMQDLTMYDLIQLRPKQAAKQLAFTDYFKLCNQLPINNYEAYGRHMSEKLSRRFFSSWALDTFCELIHYRLSIEICDMIIENLNNEVLYNICLASTGQN